MKTLWFIFSVLCTMVLTTHCVDDAQARILSYNFENDGSGNYKYSYKTSNGLTKEEIGRIVDAGSESEHAEVQGSYSYISPDGMVVTVYYVSDDKGYRVLYQPPVPTIKLTDLPPLINNEVIVGLPPSLVASILG